MFRLWWSVRCRADDVGGLRVRFRGGGAAVSAYPPVGRRREERGALGIIQNGEGELMKQIVSACVVGIGALLGMACGESATDAGTGGAGTGGSATGGAASGGAMSGGASTGGASSGGASTGGASSGGAGTGGSGSGGDASGGGSNASAFCDEYETLCGFGTTQHWADQAACETGYQTNTSQQACYEMHLGYIGAVPMMDSVHCKHAAGQEGQCGG